MTNVSTTYLSMLLRGLRNNTNICFPNYHTAGFFSHGNHMLIGRFMLMGGATLFKEQFFPDQKQRMMCQFNTDTPSKGTAHSRHLRGLGHFMCLGGSPNRELNAPLEFVRLQILTGFLSRDMGCLN